MVAIAGLFFAGQAIGAGSGNGATMGTMMQNTPAVTQLNQNQIRQMQTLLSQQGYQVGEINGVLGEQTSDAIRQFQQSQGLAVTGEPDEDTLKALAPSAEQQEFFGLSPSYGHKQMQQMEHEDWTPGGSQP